MDKFLKESMKSFFWSNESKDFPNEQNLRVIWVRKFLEEILKNCLEESPDEFLEAQNESL